MNTFTVTATELKNNSADILNRVYYEKKTALIERHGKVIAMLNPKAITVPKETPAEVWKRYGGSMPDLSDVRKFRTSNSNRFKINI